MVVNLAADYIELLLENIEDYKKRILKTEQAAIGLKQKFDALVQFRNHEARKCQSMYYHSKETLRNTQEAVAFTLRCAKKLELATAKLRYYHEYAVKNPDKIKSADVDLRVFEVEEDRMPKFVQEHKDKLEEKYGDDMLKTLEKAYLLEERGREERMMLAVEGPPGENVSMSGQGGRHQGGRGQVVGQGGQMQMAVNKQQQSAVSDERGR